MTRQGPVTAVVVVALAAALGAQSGPAERARAEAMSRRVADRLRALQREADRLAAESRTLLGDLRRLEIERTLAIDRLRQAESSLAAAEQEVRTLSARVATLEQQRVARLPDLRSRFVELYKRGPGSYARMLAGVRDLREFGRATRAIASLVHVNERRVAEHRRALEDMRQARAAAEASAHTLQSRRAAAQKARAASERAVHARTALIADIDRRRDLNAQLGGELVLAQQKLDAALRNAAGGPVDAVAVPLAPFRGALEWPVQGTLAGRFGGANQLLAGGVRNGIEIAAPEGAPVRAVHPGVVGFADSFTGYGTLVILDHDADQYTLYGYLSNTTLERGQRVQAGEEIGRVGLAPAGGAGLYFEVRIDGRSIDPVQWLRKR